MSVTELQELEEVKLLVTKGTQTGVLTYAEVATALAEVDLDETDIEDLHQFLEKSEIELVEDVDPALAAGQEERAVDGKGRRRKVKAILIAEAGGRCRLCGYAGHPAALQFHHVDRTGKRFSLSQAGVARSLARARAEARKCVLLCANCHAEVEAGARHLF